MSANTGDFNSRVSGPLNLFHFLHGARQCPCASAQEFWTSEKFFSGGGAQLCHFSKIKKLKFFANNSGIPKRISDVNGSLERSHGG